MRRPLADLRRAVQAAAFLLAAACGGAPPPDAYGNFEATEVVVSAQTGGQVLEFVPVEGMRLAPGAFAALIDTTQLALDRRQAAEQRSAAGARVTAAEEQVRVLEVQRDVALRAYERTRRLHAERAATAQQLDQAERDYRTLLAQIDAARAQRLSVSRDSSSTVARLEQIADRIAKSTVANPQGGTVLATYTNAGEVVQPGQPLYRIANLDTLDLRAYVTGAQLPALRLGEAVTVRVTREDRKLLALPGRLVWISSTAEFTPTPIQTRDERADLVYAVRIRVPNPGGVLKIGMPADATFARPAPAGRS